MSKIIPLTKGHITIVDDEDYESLACFKWYWSAGTAHRKRREGDRYVLLTMSRVIMNAPVGMVVDHINGDRLDNRKSNLRICTFAENTRNTRVRTHATKQSRYKGVARSNRKKPWRGYISKDYKNYFLGHFASEEEAARAYDARAREIFGEFAKLNFPTG